MKDLVVDTIGLSGAALITYGAWLVYRPAGFIIAGVFLLAAAWLAAARGA